MSSQTKISNIGKFPIIDKNENIQKYKEKSTNYNNKLLSNFSFKDKYSKGIKSHQKDLNLCLINNESNKYTKQITPSTRSSFEELKINKKSVSQNQNLYSKLKFSKHIYFDTFRKLNVKTSKNVEIENKLTFEIKFVDCYNFTFNGNDNKQNESPLKRIFLNKYKKIKVDEFSENVLLTTIPNTNKPLMKDYNKNSFNFEEISDKQIFYTSNILGKFENLLRKLINKFR